MYSIFTTVTDQASSYDLTSLANAKAELGITVTTYDTILARYVKSASIAAAQYCNRVFVVETVQDKFFRLVNSARMFYSRPDVLQLSRWPIVDAVTSVVEDGTTLVVGTDFLTDLTNGQLTRIDSSGLRRAWCASIITVQYDAGYETIPADIEDAVLRMVSSRYSAKGRDRNVKQETVDGVGSRQFWIATGNEAGNLSPDVADILDNYRVPSMGA